MELRAHAEQHFGSRFQFGSSTDWLAELDRISIHDQSRLQQSKSAPVTAPRQASGKVPMQPSTGTTTRRPDGSVRPTKLYHCTLYGVTSFWLATDISTVCNTVAKISADETRLCTTGESGSNANAQIVRCTSECCWYCRAQVRHFVFRTPKLNVVLCD